MSRAQTTTEADAHDDELLAQGRHAELLARHQAGLRAHAVARLARRGIRQGGEDVAQTAFVRLCAELASGKRYTVPFRVAAHMIVCWSADDFVADHLGAPAALPDDHGAHDADVDGVVLRVSLETAIGELPAADHDAARAVWLEGATPAEAAAAAGCSRNAIDQALFRARSRLREVFDGS